MRPSTGPARVQALKKTGSRMPLRLKKKLYLAAVTTFHTRLTPVVMSPCRTSSDPVYIQI